MSTQFTVVSSTGEDVEVTTRLRPIRLLHWKKFVYERRAEQHARDLGMNLAADVKAKQAAMHLGFVQVLNDFFELGDTAEADHHAEMKSRRTAVQEPAEK